MHMSLDFNCSDGKAVITKDGKRLGTIVGVSVDTAGWSVTKIKVSLGKEVGETLSIKKPFMKPRTLALRKEAVAAVGDMITLSVDLKSLRDYMA